MGGSMGAATGEKITNGIERALQGRVPLLIISASGGARMQEGMLSLMQLAKTAAALGRLGAAGIPYISLLTDPTMGGVTASFASLADVIVAEPGAMIGFAGARVIQQATYETLPEGFQTAEFLWQHGMIDLVVPRPELPAVIRQLLDLYTRDGFHSDFELKGQARAAAQAAAHIRPRRTTARWRRPPGHRSSSPAIPIVPLPWTTSTRSSAISSSSMATGSMATTTPSSAGRPPSIIEP